VKGKISLTISYKLSVNCRLTAVVIQSLRTDIERMLKRVKEITYEPQLLSPTAEQKLASAAAAAAGRLACYVMKLA